MTLPLLRLNGRDISYELDLNLISGLELCVYHNIGKVDYRRSLIQDNGNIFNWKPLRCEMWYGILWKIEWGNTSEILHEKYENQVGTFLIWILQYYFKFQLGFLNEWMKEKLKNVSNSNESQIKFPWTCCKFEMGLLLTSSFEKK